jgi:hypothetical protein
MTNVIVRAKGPQPVLDDLVGTPASTTSGRGDIHNHNLHSTTPQTNGFSRATAQLARSSTYLTAEINGDGYRSRSASPGARPGLIRAKSDFGPRRDENRANDDSDSKHSAETEWGIRHGFDTQLASEDYNHLLTEARIPNSEMAHMLTMNRTSSSISRTRSMSRAADQKGKGYKNLLFFKNGA